MLPELLAYAIRSANCLASAWHIDRTPETLISLQCGCRHQEFEDRGRAREGGRGLMGSLVVFCWQLSPPPGAPAEAPFLHSLEVALAPPRLASQVD